MDDITINYRANLTNKGTNSQTFGSNALTWYHDNGALTPAAPINKNFGSNADHIVNVSVTPLERIWTVVNSEFVPTANIIIPKSIIETIQNDNVTYVMIVSDDYTFTNNVTSTTLKETETDFIADFYFEGTKYITFGTTAVSLEMQSSAAFDGTDKYLTAGDINDLSNSNYTISAWVLRDPGSTNFDIVSKRNYSSDDHENFIDGYALCIDADGKFAMEWKNTNDPTITKITSVSTLPENQWHHIAVTFNASNNSVILYVDGAEETNTNGVNPLQTISDAHFMIGATNYMNRQHQCSGNIDEIRVWDVALSQDQLRYIMNQELANNNNFVDGKILPNTITKNEIASIPWANLVSYYPMNRFVFGSAKDESIYGNDAVMMYYANIEKQTAPLPYKTTKNGNWDNANTWLNGDVQYIPGIKISNEISKTIDYNIVEIDHEIIMDNENTSLIPEGKDGVRTLLSLTINTEGKLIVKGDNLTEEGCGIEVSHYLNLNGKIDLEGESQLIQNEGSVLDAASSGSLERDQQGTKDLYSYNHWSAPVGVCNTATNNNSYNLSTNILKNGTVSATPKNITFLSSSYNGNISGTDIEIADFWIWKYTNLPSSNYSTWQHIRSNGSIKPGEGFTMKGVESSTNSFVSKQNYVFEGKPFNGDIIVNIQANNEYLVGNPYASALDANAFIKDNISIGIGEGRNTNGNVINGALYFWDHFGSGSHTLDEYEGGYAVYTLMGGIPALNHDNRVAATGVVRTNIWERYIPVGQGFFVSSIFNINNSNITVDGGDLVFKNSQRLFKKESSNPTLDERQKIRLKFDSPNGYHRQLLLGADTNCSAGFDLGYEAPLIENNKEDMYWMFDSSKLLIQAVDTFDELTRLPIGLKINKSGIATISIDSLENVANELTVLVHDKLNKSNHDLRQSDFAIALDKGTYQDRFEIAFSNMELLSASEFENNDIAIYVTEENNVIQITNSKSKLIESLEVYNLIGQKINDINVMSNNKALTFRNHISGDGIYIVKVHTDERIVTKKFIVRG